jgi:two-component system sensor histidine kinase RegB
MYNHPLSLATPVQHLRHLVIIRMLVLACLYIGAAMSLYFIDTAIPTTPIVITLSTFTVITTLTFFRTKHELPVSDVEFFIQLLIDIICLSTLFYCSGGASNPFVFYFLVPICIAAATLPWGYTWLITLLCITSYTLLLFFYIPMPILSPEHGVSHAEHQPINFHILGMWANFFISAMLITYFVVRMANDLRHQEKLLNQRREDELRDEQLMAVATLAAGTAHELGTPLSTMKVLLRELINEHQYPLELHQDLELLSSQVEQCAHTLRQLVDKAEQTKTGKCKSELIHDFCLSIIERWKIMRPEVTSKIIMDTNSPSIEYAFHPTITQSIINLLNNAADANPNNLSVFIFWDMKQLIWKIDDNGSGIPLELAGQLGKAFITTKGHGLGLGLFLTHATVARYGGQVRLYARENNSGTTTEFIFPLQAIEE